MISGKKIVVRSGIKQSGMHMIVHGKIFSTKYVKIRLQLQILC